MLITFYTALLGLFTGLTYSFALGFAWDDGVEYGLGIGLILGVLLFIVQRFLTARNAINAKDTQMLSSYMLVMFMAISVFSGIIVWLFRVAIF
ncbi:hypothetical protein [Mucilaginibacter ginkgonis]|uniref:Uncharacterized protein n=1 Tax=Mucilaginibacter ginkgonis TaxID=2682091 RepID=A0A6I4IP74_9SPHI|nr:hypothetical protein [Mucilaginibacter ginkgonis]QQL50507.1 hypothetical protein GO620_003365 [Mucilaginibacter ginkgonis]